MKHDPEWQQQQGSVGAHCIIVKKRYKRIRDRSRASSSSEDVLGMLNSHKRGGRQQQREEKKNRRGERATLSRNTRRYREVSRQNPHVLVEDGKEV